MYDATGPDHFHALDLFSRVPTADLRRCALAVRRYWRFVALSALACLSLSLAYLAVAKRVYQATARVIILQRGTRPLNVGGSDPARTPEDLDDLLSTHSAAIGSPLVVGRAIEAFRPGGDTGPKPVDEAKAYEPVESALKNLSVTRPDRLARVLQIDYRAASPAEAARFLDALVASYREFLSKDFSQSGNGVLRLIENAKGQLESELGGMEKRYVEFRREHPSITAAKKGRSYHEHRVEQWGLEAADAMARTVKIKAKLEMGRKLADGGAEFWAIAHAMSELGGTSGELLLAVDPRSAQGVGSDYIRQLLREQQRLSEEFGPGYTKVAELRDRITRAQELTRGRGGRIDQGETRALIDSTSQTLATLESMQADYKKRFEDDLRRANEDEVVLIKDANLRSSLDRHRSLLNAVLDQLKQAELLNDYSCIGVQLIAPPRRTERPVKPSVGITVALGLLSGCFIGLAAALLGDRFESRFYSAGEPRDHLGARVFGAVPRLPAAVAGSPPEAGRVAQERPTSRWAEAYHSVRTKVELAGRRHPVRTVLVTSPKAGDGKSVTASNLAISFAHAGRKVLLIDADLRRPSQHDVFGISGAAPGLAGLLRDGSALAPAVARTPVPNLDLLPAGRSVPGAVAVLTPCRWAALLAEAGSAYDRVVVDSPPLLSTADGAVLAAGVDCLALVLRTTETTRRVAGRVAQVLADVGPPVIGAVFNAEGPGNMFIDYYHEHAYADEPEGAEDATRVGVNGHAGAVSAGCPRRDAARYE
jgi:capsular exopolysaccharide synthesis family protein